MPHSAAVLDRLADRWEEDLLQTPMGELEVRWRESALNLLRRSGYLDDPEARARWLANSVESWAIDARDQVAGWLGWQYIELHAQQPVGQLDADAQGLIIGYLQDQQLFVDEDRLQDFLVRQRLIDLPAETAEAALLHLIQNRLERLGRKLSR